MSNHEVISAFLDSEAFDANELGHVLAEPGGRELLLDLVTLHVVVQEDGTDGSAVVPAVKTPSRAWWFVSAAAVMVAVAGGFAVGSMRATRSEVTATQAAPAPTRVLKLETGVNWSESQSMKGGQ